MSQSYFLNSSTDFSALSLSHVWLVKTLWTVVHQAPLSRGFPRQEYWSGLPFPPLGIKPASPALASRFFTTALSGKPHDYILLSNSKFTDFARGSRHHMGPRFNSSYGVDRTPWVKEWMIIFKGMKQTFKAPQGSQFHLILSFSQQSSQVGNTHLRRGRPGTLLWMVCWRVFGDESL